MSRTALTAATPAASSGRVLPGRARTGCSSSKPARCTSRFSFSTHSRRAATRACAVQRTAGEHAGAADGVTGGGVVVREHQRDGGSSLPPSCCGRRQRLRKARTGQLAGDRLGDGELADRQVGRRAHQVAVLRQHLEAALLGVPHPALDRVEVAEEDVHRRVVEREPGAAVHDRPPLAELGHVASVAQPANVVGVERSPAAAVVDAEIPVAVRPVRPGRPRAAEDHGDHLGQGGHLAGQRRDGPGKPRPGHACSLWKREPPGRRPAPGERRPLGAPGAACAPPRPARPAPHRARSARRRGPVGKEGARRRGP
jgi:hypothetical protein